MNKREDEHDDLNGATQALFRAARRVHDPSAADRARVDAALASRLIAAQQASASTRGGPLDLRALWRRGAALKVASVALFMAAGVSMFASERRAWPAPPEQVPKPAVPAPAPQPSQAPHGAAPTSAAPAALELARGTDVRAPRSARPRGRGPGVASKARDSRGELAAAGAARGSAPAVVRAPRADQAEAASAPSPQPALGKPERSVALAASDHASQSDITQAPVARAEVSPQKVSTSPDKPALLQASATTSRHSRSDDSPAELKLVADMHAALTRADFALALALCLEHERRWPRGEFALEREGVRAIAGCKSHASEADAHATRFLAEHPHAPVAMRVRAACTPQPTATREH